MKQIDRLEYIIQKLRSNSYTIHELKKTIDKVSLISLRQIQRDLLEINKIISKSEKLIIFRKKYLKYYKIESNKDFQDDNYIRDNKIETKFYNQILSNINNDNLTSINSAINENKVIVISKLLNDETGDNFSFADSNILFIPLKIINHRSSTYVGGYNFKLNQIQIFGINQLNKITIKNNHKNTKELNLLLENELISRFGVSKNIDSNIYDIKIEVSSILAGFITNHFWHPSQKFTKRKGNTIVHFKCGINRELMGWLFQWMYNIRILEPPILKSYYDRTILEIQKNNNSKHPLVYRNIFVENKKT